MYLSLGRFAIDFRHVHLIDQVVDTANMVSRLVQCDSSR